ncbi:MAG: hypothetical protein LBC70_09480 [Chitinispirillales bacterium]|jgi:hypothetical protein|nr:hypothetical protein [Chitinispirillales bacterium]
MNRVIRISVLAALLLALAAGTVSAQGQRTIMERNIWYVDGNGQIHNTLYWRIFLGDYRDVQLIRNIPGEGQVTISAGMNFQLLSSGYIEGNGASARGVMHALPGMRMRLSNGTVEEIRVDHIDYIYDYGTKVATTDGRKGDFLMLVDGNLLEIRRFQITEFRMSTGQFGEPELRPVSNIQLMPIVALAFSREGADRAAKEAVTH